MAEPGLHLVAQQWVERQLAYLGPPAASSGGLFGLGRAIADSSTIAGHLTRDRRGRPPDPSRYSATGLLGCQAPRNLLPLRHRQLMPRFHSRPRTHTASHQHVSPNGLFAPT